MPDRLPKACAMIADAKIADEPVDDEMSMVIQEAKQVTNALCVHVYS